MNIILIFTTLFVALLLVSLYLLTIEDFDLKQTDTYMYLDENDKVINQVSTERIEQESADKYIEDDDVILELGGRYGTVSGVLLSKIKNPLNLVIIEPDKNICDILLSNLARNGFTNVNLWKGTVGSKRTLLTDNGYSSITYDCEDNNDNCIPNISIDDLQKKYGVYFNTLVADCEGCMESFIAHLQSSTRPVSTWKKIMFEQDQPELCNYDNIKQLLIDNGFECIQDDFYMVWINTKI